MSADIGRDPYTCEMPDAVLVCQEMQVAIETQRFGFDPVGTCPEILLRLNHGVSKELFLPCTEEGQFVPRRRVLYGTVYGEKVTLYFYNFMPFLSASLMNMVARATSWYNSRARLVREIGLHKMGISHLSPLEHLHSSSDNPYLVLVWRHSEELVDKDYPPDDLQVTAIDALPKGYSKSLFRLYRRACEGFIKGPEMINERNSDHPYLFLNRSPCLIQDQLEQMRYIRMGVRIVIAEFKKIMKDQVFKQYRGTISGLPAKRNVREQLNMTRTFSSIHDLLLDGRNTISVSQKDDVPNQRYSFKLMIIAHRVLEVYVVPICLVGVICIPTYFFSKESDLGKIKAASKLVHFVETPVLFFPKWRRNIAIVRQVRRIAELDTRKTKIPTGSQQPSTTTRQRANTLSVTSLAPTPFRIKSEIGSEDPCQAKILYLLMGDYIMYLSSLGLQLVNVTNLDRRSEERYMYTTTYPQGCKYAPYVVMHRTMKGGIVLATISFTQPYFAFKVFIWHPTNLCEAINEEESCPDAVRKIRELQQFKDLITTQCHIHSFTYDFHLRMLSKYLVGKDKVLFSPGYNTHAFLVDFLEYYGCRPPSARNCVYE
ncbi:hypothetical protein NECAME_06110, partial [Necator americanus]